MDEVLALALEGPLPATIPAGTEALSAVPSNEISANLPPPQ
jgi:hypothetical protein